MKARSLFRKSKVIASVGLIVGVLVVGTGPAFAGGGSGGGSGGGGYPGGANTKTLYVSNSSRSRHADGYGAWGCFDTPYSTINSAVAAASAGNTIVVCPGTYTEDVVINKALTLRGQRATIDAAGLNNAVQVVSSGVTVSGFTLTKAIGEGILVGADTTSDPAWGTSLTNVGVFNNRVIDDDQGFAGAGGAASTCNYLPLPSDCGGGIHFVAVSHSNMSGNVVTGNADGILLTDEYGPTAYNLVANNWVYDNATECGITLPSHNGGAVSYNSTTFAVTGTNPTVGGVFDNKIINNVSVNNGTIPANGSGSGAGVGIFAPFPGTGAYNNLVQGNYLAGNGLAGVTIHSHAPGQDVNGNVIVGNTIGQNNIDGDGDNGPVPGPQDLVTTGISVFSAASPIQMTIAGNHIANNDVGIWYTAATVTANGLATNSFFKVTIPIEAAS
jgi:parallel beta-helix repeat protein